MRAARMIKFFQTWEINSLDVNDKISADKWSDGTTELTKPDTI